MSTFGKVLLFLNLLAAGGLVYVSAQDWAKRQDITGVVLRYHLVLQGVPIEPAKVDSTEEVNEFTLPVEITSPAGVTIMQMSKKLLQDQFKGFEGGDAYGAKGEEVVARSLLTELSRVEKLVLSQVEAQQGDEGKLAFLVGGADARGLFQPGLLMNEAESYEERVAVRALNFPKPPTPELAKKNLDDAKARLARKIEALKNAPAPKQLDEITKTIDELKKAIEKDPKDADSKAKLNAFSAQGAPAFTRDDSDRRRRITLFLIMLDSSGPWQKRCVLVAGLKTYLATLTEQVARLGDINRLTERGQEIDQAAFENEYELLKRLALKQDLLVTDQDGLLKGLVEMDALDAASKAAREAQLNALKTQLAKLQNNIKAVLDRQATAEQAVFKLQRQVGDTLRGNLELESSLDRAEQKK
ncbi:hypothetical protein BH11PLA2_BH11PLA2_21400 [soil metagenome]